MVQKENCSRVYIERRLAFKGEAAIFFNLSWKQKGLELDSSVEFAFSLLQYAQNILGNEVDEESCPNHNINYQHDFHLDLKTLYQLHFCIVSCFKIMLVFNVGIVHFGYTVMCFVTQKSFTV